MDTVRARAESVFRSEYGRALATLVRLLGDIDRAEESLQEAFRIALEQWPESGIPTNPRSWLISTARFKGIDAVRRAERGEELGKQHAIELWRVQNETDSDPVLDGEQTIEDDHLRLIFLCCHPRLPMDARISLALREVCGLTIEEIARAYLISREAAKKRVTRAKQTVRQKRLPFEIPPRRELGTRINAVLRVIYLIYNEGYSASAGDDHIRSELTGDAVSLARLLARLMPSPETNGLLALLLLHDSRAAARVDSNGDLIALEEQDRSRWDRALIREGTVLVQQSFLSGRLGSYAIQAAIASVHANAPSVQETDFTVIVSYYDLLLRIRHSPVVALNRAIAVGMRDGPAAALPEIRELTEGTLSNYHPAHAARADLAGRAGYKAEAIDSYEKAISLARQAPERRYLEKQKKNVGS